jgi:hypothetical protein
MHTPSLAPALAAATVLTLAATGPAAEPAHPALALTDRWFYLATNLATDANIDKAAALFARAEKAGYTGVLLTDSKFARLGEMNPHYFANVDRLKKSAADHHLEIIPCVFPIGWSNDLLYHNPNLAEGLPVKKARFAVKGQEARLAPDPPVTLKAGNFADLKQWAFHDPGVSYDPAEKAAHFLADGKNQRIMQKVPVSPWREYRLTVRLKTRDFRGPFEAKALAADTGPAAGTPLTFTRWQIPATGDWKTYTLVFNSLDHSAINVYFGTWGGRSGSAWAADATLEEVGLLNALRRPGTPLAVTRDDGTPLVEGRDFETYKDPKMGNIPWPGEYDTAHDAPPLHLLKPLPEGTHLRVSWYHPMIVETGSVMICLSEPETVKLLKDQAARLHKTFAAKSYFMAHDEIRVLNWCAACQARHLTPGQILADNVRTCTALLKDLSPRPRLFTWSDMFDPNHNAHAGYYLVNGDLAGSWEGLDKDTKIALWYLSQRDASLKFFTSRGHQILLAGYYDAPVPTMRQWLTAAATYAPSVTGTMYTTWQQNYADLEPFAALVDEYRTRP